VVRTRGSGYSFVFFVRTGQFVVRVVELFYLPVVRTKYRDLYNFDDFFGRVLMSLGGIVPGRLVKSHIAGRDHLI
jgi:hypothetical protein